MNRRELARMFVLDVIADDYENLEKICMEATGLSVRAGLSIMRSEILQALVDLIKADLAKAYRLTTIPTAEEIQGVPPLEKFGDYYFWVTSKGRNIQVSDYPGWPFDENGLLRTDWVAPEK